MTITNGYTTLTDLKTRLDMTTASPADNTKLEGAIAAASRQFDAHCGRRFWQDSTVKARTYAADEHFALAVDDISTATGLIVKLDEDDDGTFETTVTIGTNFVTYPLNAALEVPVRPFTELRLIDGASTFPIYTTARAGVEVTAKFGWPAVPDDVTQACLIQAKNLYKSTSGTFAGFQADLGSGIVVRNRVMSDDVRGLLEPYVRGWVG